MQHSPEVFQLMYDVFNAGVLGGPSNAMAEYDHPYPVAADPSVRRRESYMASAGGVGRVKIVPPVGVHVLVTVLLEQLANLRALRFFVVVFDGHRPKAVPIEREPAQSIKLGALDVQTHEMNECRCPRAHQDLVQGRGGQRDRRRLDRRVLPRAERLGEAAVIAGIVKRHSLAGFVRHDVLEHVAGAPTHVPRERIDTDAFPSPGFEGLRVRLHVAVARTNVEEEAIRNAGENGFGDPFVLADLRLVAGDSKGFAKTEADVARGRYQAAAFVFVEPSMRLVSDGGANRRAAQHSHHQSQSSHDCPLNHPPSTRRRHHGHRQGQQGADGSGIGAGLQQREDNAYSSKKGTVPAASYWSR